VQVDSLCRSQTTVVPFRSVPFSYGEMAAVALDKYGLVLTDNHLPMGCLDQGLDVLQIMRHIDVFVRRYNYNINQQFFVVRSRNSNITAFLCTLHSFDWHSEFGCSLPIFVVRPRCSLACRRRRV
jgi:hypothetical protein